ncbi:FeoB-associated Cys-rich membrane protein [Tropicimonas sp. IMCC6043]|uniref:FeoB-associated Cys-rich membrane protein n=1 Tax=Tropicimonas sp. IMCC6043 TaxID=2510645 RepID=UPI00101D683C|nr:FeoB-associated Cys-rich membrane protein [Tropicimonas sp. IMCC6043]RYH11133.1 hypothetical protein EU800_04535 [Tropicimonas sp. IMCC6043]
MTESTQPLIDIGAEAATGPLEIAVIALIGALALAYLLRGFLRRRAKAASGEGCSGCPGCTATGGCPAVTHFPLPEGRERG